TAAGLVQIWLSKSQDYKIDPDFWQAVYARTAINYLAYLSRTQNAAKFGVFLDETQRTEGQKNSAQRQPVNLDEIIEGVCKEPIRSESIAKILFNAALRSQFPDALRALLSHFSSYALSFPDLAALGQGIFEHTPLDCEVVSLFETPA